LREMKADEKARERADEVFVISRPQRLKEYSRKRGLELRESRLFARGETIDDYMGDSLRFAGIAFETDLGEVSPSFRTDVGYCVLSPMQIVEETIADFEEVAAEAAEKAKVSKAEMLAGRIARELRSRVNEKITEEEKDFETACKELKLEVEESGYFRRDDLSMEKIGTAYGVASSAFQSEPGRLNNYPRRTDKGYFFFALSEVKPPTDEEFVEEKDSYYDELVREKGQEAFREWSAALWEEANVKSYSRPAPRKTPKTAAKKSPRGAASPKGGLSRGTR